MNSYICFVSHERTTIASLASYILSNTTVDSQRIRAVIIVFSTCGGGMRRRSRDLRGWPWWRGDQKFRRCRKSESHSKQSEHCNTMCFAHGTWSAWYGQCNCDVGYTGLCCQQSTYASNATCIDSIILMHNACMRIY